MENINLNVEAEKDYSSGEENEYDLIETNAVEVNNLDNKSNDYLLVGIYGNGSGFLKSSLYTDLKVNVNSYKIKFMTRIGKDSTKAKKIAAEIHQFTLNNISHLVMHTKQNFTDQSFKSVIDYLKTNGITYKRVAIFDSAHLSSTVGLELSGVFCLKNSMQMKSNQLIKVKNLPAPNTVQSFAAYLLTYHEVVDIPCVVYLAVSDLYEVCLDSVRLYNETSPTYAFFREKLSQDFFNSHQIQTSTIHTLFKEFNAFKNLVYC
jgi:hypothetical protein